MGKSYPFYNTTIGFDRLFDELTRNHTQTNAFPPHNIIKEDDEHYVIELAVAGYSPEDLEVQVENGVLSVKTIEGSFVEREYLHKGISSKHFIKQFTLADDVIVNEVDLNNGILAINLERIIPEEKKPRVIPIGGVKPQLLNESA